MYSKLLSGCANFRFVAGHKFVTSTKTESRKNRNIFVIKIADRVRTSGNLAGLTIMGTAFEIFRAKNFSGDEEVAYELKE